MRLAPSLRRIGTTLMVLMFCFSFIPKDAFATSPTISALYNSYNYSTTSINVSVSIGSTSDMLIVLAMADNNAEISSVTIANQALSLIVGVQGSTNCPGNIIGSATNTKGYLSAWWIDLASVETGSNYLYIGMTGSGAIEYNVYEVASYASTHTIVSASSWEVDPFYAGPNHSNTTTLYGIDGGEMPANETFFEATLTWSVNASSASYDITPQSLTNLAGWSGTPYSLGGYYSTDGASAPATVTAYYNATMTTANGNVYGLDIIGIQFFIGGGLIHSVMVDTSPSGLADSLTIDGVTYTSPQTFAWEIGSSHSLSANSISGYTFSSWNDSGTQTHNITVEASTSDYVATYTASSTSGTSMMWIIAFLLLFTPCSLLWTILKILGLVVSEQTFLFMTNLGLIIGGLLGLVAQVLPLGVVGFIVIIFVVSLWTERT